MYSTRRTTVVVAAAVAALLCAPPVSAAAQSPESAPSPGAVSQAVGVVTQSAYCGSGWNGLAVFAVTLEQVADCSSALRVTNAYGVALEAGHVDPVTVRVDDVEWRCEERQGGVNPYTECVNLTNVTERAQLVS